VSAGRRTFALDVKLDREELALRIAIQCLGIRPPPGTKATEALDTMDTVPTLDPNSPRMGEGFRRAADAAIAYFGEQIRQGKAVS
jgi:hypothetical protein